MAGLSPADLLAPVLAALRAELPVGVRIDDVLIGSSRPTPGNLARVAALQAGLGVEVPGVTLDRQCAGGLEAVRMAGALVSAGLAEVVLAGGVDSASALDDATGVGEGGASGRPSAQARFAPDGYADPQLGVAAEELARLLGIGRDRQDAYALRSHALTLAASRAGLYDAELVPVGTMTRDDRPRRLSAETLQRLRPAFTPDPVGTVTAGNACGIADGAAAVTVTSESFRRTHGLSGLRIIDSAVRAGDPALPGLGALEATRAVLARSGVKLDEVAVIEVTEAFAAQVLALTDGLGLKDLDGAPAVCPDGGAIGLGHPWGASGAMLLGRLHRRLVPQGSERLGIATTAVAGGQGVAVLVESVT